MEGAAGSGLLFRVHDRLSSVSPLSPLLVLVRPISGTPLGLSSSGVQCISRRTVSLLS